MVNILMLLTPWCPQQCARIGFPSAVTGRTLLTYATAADITFINCKSLVSVLHATAVSTVRKTFCR